MSNMDLYKKICAQVTNVMDEAGFKTDRVFAKIYGIPCRVRELEVRALQVMAKRAAEKSEEDFSEFCKNVIIYSSRYPSDEGFHQMIFRTDGKFENEFAPGFYDVSANLAFELF